MWQKFQKFMTSFNGIISICVITLILFLLFWWSKNNIIIIIMLVLLGLLFFTVIYQFLGMKYKTKDTNYYQNKFISITDKYITPALYIPLIIIFFLLFVIFSKAPVGSVGEWVAAITSSGAVFLALYQNFHKDYPNLVIKSNKSKKTLPINNKYIEIDITIQNIDERIIDLKCVKTKGIYFCYPSKGNWVNNYPVGNIINNINNNVSDASRKKIMNPILKLDSFDDPKSKNTSGSLHLYIDKDAKAFRIILEDIHNNKEINITSTKIHDWKIPN